MTAYAGLELLSTAVLMLDERLTVTYANPNPGFIKSHGVLNASIDY